MIIKRITFLISVFAMLLLASCISDSAASVEYEDSLSDEYYSENIPNYVGGFRTTLISTAVASPRDQIVHVGEIEVSRTGVVFMLENRTDLEFFYGEPWDLAFYTDDRWMPVMYVTEIIDWNAIGFWLQSGGIKRYRIEWERLFGELPPGRYMFIRAGRLGEQHQEIRDQNRVYALVEFIINEDCPIFLSPASDEVWQDYINFVKYKDVTPNGMTIVVANASDYDIDFHADINFVVPQVYVVSDNWREWRQHFIPRLLIGYYRVHGEGFLQRDELLEFFLDWSIDFGELPPGNYALSLRLGGRAHPPHPYGVIPSSTPMISFSVGD